MKKKFLLLSLIIILGFLCNSVFSTFFSSNSEIKNRVRRYFKIAQFSQINPEIIHSSISTKIPVGSSKKELYNFLDETTLGKDHFSICSKMDAETNSVHDLTCSINLNTSMFNLDFRRISYEIIFRIDETGKLEDIEVKELITTL
jgi:hypothetical protein